MPRDRYSGGRPRQEQLISQRAVYGLRADSPNYVEKYTRAEIDAINKRYALIANKRLARLEKAELTKSSAAYRYIRKASYSGFEFATAKNRFKTSSRSLDNEDAIEMLYQLHQFLFNTKTSTVSGTKEVNKKKVNEAFKALEEKHQGLLDKVNQFAEDNNIKDRDDMLSSFFNSEVIDRLIELYGSDYVDEIIDGITGSLNLSDGAALDLIEKFLNSTSTYPATPFDFIGAVINYYDRLKKSTNEDDAAAYEMNFTSDNMTYEGWDL